MKPTIKISDLATGEVIERELNDEEYQQWLINRQSSEDRVAAEQLKRQKKAELLEKLGITAEEAKLLLG